jgi:regulatory protein
LIDKEDHATSDVPVLRRAAMDFLARREHSFFELQRKLSDKFPEVDTSDLFEVLDALRAEGLQSDERFTEAFVRYRSNRGFAFHHILRDLESRRVSSNLIGQNLFEDDECWEVMAVNLLERKLGENQHIEFASKQHQKLLRLLESRGFPHQVSRKAVEKFL